MLRQDIDLEVEEEEADQTQEACSELQDWLSLVLVPCGLSTMRYSTVRLEDVSEASWTNTDGLQSMVVVARSSTVGMISLEILLYEHPTDRIASVSVVSVKTFTRKERILRSHGSTRRSSTMCAQNLATSPP